MSSEQPIVHSLDAAGKDSNEEGYDVDPGAASAQSSSAGMCELEPAQSSSSSAPQRVKRFKYVVCVGYAGTGYNGLQR
jgi:hypothetical protein